MKYGSFFTSALVAFVLAACTSTSMETDGKVWYKENGTAQERDQLLAAAKVQAQQAHAGATLGSADTTATRHQSEVEATMTYMSARGWRLISASEAKQHKPTAARATPSPGGPSPASAISGPAVDR